jgi:diguanylate cyclase (GGDEF)-like protein
VLSPWLIALSGCVAVCAALAALILASRVARVRTPTGQIWLAGGAIATGIGLWSMHFISMLALQLPIAVSFDAAPMVLSMLIAIATSATALISARREHSAARLGLAVLAVGIGLAGMHYCGMAAMQIIPAIHYQIISIFASALLAMVAAFFWLSIATRIRAAEGPRGLLLLGAGAIVVGATLETMLYTASSGAQFAVGTTALFSGAPDSRLLALTVGGLALGGLAVTIVTALFDARWEQRTRRHRAALDEANAQLQHLATHDVLTGLPNRHLLQDEARRCIARVGQGEIRFALMILDIDRFKTTNDSLGHQGGDELLRQISQRLSLLVRRGDTLARLGSDEFVMMVHHVTDRTEAEAVANRILLEIARPFTIGNADVHATASIAISMYPEHAVDVDTLLIYADTALYHAKKSGRGAVQFYVPGMSDSAHERVELESGLRRALQNSEFELFFQPKVNIQTGNTNSAEALIRWFHPTRGMVSPDQFIPMAEETGLIIPIGEWVIREACRRARSWQLAGIAPLRVAVNLSAQQFRQKDLLETVQRALRDTGLDPSLLELELTESAVMENAEESARILAQLSRLGVQISIDDFGTGYSSLSYLKRFPLDKLKIDRSFIRDLATDVDDAAIVRAIISLAHSLKLKVIAEGVETADQLDFLRQLGCDQYQGYHCSPPMAPDAFAAWMQTHQLQSAPYSEADMMKTHSRLSVAALKKATVRRLKD